MTHHHYMEAHLPVTNQKQRFIKSTRVPRNPHFPSTQKAGTDRNSVMMHHRQSLFYGFHPQPGVSEVMGLPPMADSQQHPIHQSGTFLRRMDQVWYQNGAVKVAHPVYMTHVVYVISAVDYVYMQRRQYEEARRRAVKIEYKFCLLRNYSVIAISKKIERFPLLFQVDARTQDIVQDGTVQSSESNWEVTNFRVDYCYHNDTFMVDLTFNGAFEMRYRFKEPNNSFELYFCSQCPHTSEVHLFPKYVEIIEGQKVFHVLNSHRSVHEQYVYDAYTWGFTQVYYPDHPFDEAKTIRDTVIDTVKDRCGMETMICRDLDGRVCKWRCSPDECNLEKLGAVQVKSMSVQKYEKFCGLGYDSSENWVARVGRYVEFQYECGRLEADRASTPYLK